MKTVRPQPRQHKPRVGENGSARGKDSAVATTVPPLQPKVPQSTLDLLAKMIEKEAEEIADEMRDRGYTPEQAARDLYELAVAVAPAGWVPRGWQD